MSLPKYYELYVPFLTAIRDENTHSLKDIKQTISEFLQLEFEKDASVFKKHLHFIG